MRSPVSHAARLSFATLTAVTLCAGVARGDGPAAAPPPMAADARARALFDEAGKLLSEAKVEEACRKLAESEALVPDPKTLQRLATCEEAEGKLAHALAAYKQLLALSGRSLRGARERNVKARMQRLEASVPRLVVRIAPETVATPDLEVRACGVVLRDGESGVPLPEDPGTCEVTAHAPGKAAWSKTVELGSHGERAEVLVPPLTPEAPQPEATATADTAPAAPAESAAPEPPAPPPPTGPITEKRVTGIALLALGAGLAGAGAYFGSAAIRSSHDADALCPGTTCANPEGLHLNSRAITEAKLADLTFGAGAMSLVTGIVVLATIPSRAKPAHPTTGFWVRPTLGGLAMGGAF